jgi:hypothetical protein
VTGLGFGPDYTLPTDVVQVTGNSVSPVRPTAARVSAALAPAPQVRDGFRELDSSALEVPPVAIARVGEPEVPADRLVQ